MTVAAARKLAPAPQPSAARTRELFAEGLKRVDVQGLAEADREYGDDYARELVDIEAGRHPLQRRSRSG